MRIGICLGILFLNSLYLAAQQESTALNSISQLPDRLFNKINSKAIRLDDRISRKMVKYLNRVVTEEKKLQQKLSRKDSAAAKNIFTRYQEKYSGFKSRIESSSDSGDLNPLHEYIPGLDSIQTSLRFLGNKQSGYSDLSSVQLKEISAANTALQRLQAKLQQAGDVEQFMKQRSQQLKDELSGYGLGKELISLNKNIFYYQQQLAEYKNLLHDPDRLGRRLLAALRDIPVFKDYFQKNSYLGQLFSLPENYGSTAVLAGLQTRSQVQQLMAGNIGSAGNGGGVNPEQFAMQQVEQAKGMISQLKNKLKDLENPGGNGDLVMPDGFSKNNQKTRTFLKRIEYGFNLQTQPGTNILPSTAGLAVFAGYKLTDNISLGVGGNYRLGIGSGFNHIRFSNQGIGFKSYADIKIKFNLWFSGGLEYNYIAEFQNLTTIQNLDAWQKSAVFGLMKTVQVTKNKQTTIQLLFDALYKQHIPASSPVIFRMGYKFQK